jgi:NADP-dependent 3-hydroxy acid dehydrogenase YdfG
MVEGATSTIDPLNGRTALVTGASSGIGEAKGHVLAADGADMVLAARREERLASIADDIRRESDASVTVVPTDVTDPDAVRGLVDAAVDRFDGLGIAVCNADLAIDEPVAELSHEQYRTMTGVTVDGMFYTARETIPPPGRSRSTGRGSPAPRAGPPAGRRSRRRGSGPRASRRTPRRRAGRVGTARRPSR